MVGMGWREEYMDLRDNRDEINMFLFWPGLWKRGRRKANVYVSGLWVWVTATIKRWKLRGGKVWGKKMSLVLNILVWDVCGIAKGKCQVEGCSKSQKINLEQIKVLTDGCYELLRKGVEIVGKVMASDKINAIYLSNGDNLSGLIMKTAWPETWKTLTHECVDM